MNKTQIVRHGEVILSPVDNIPTEAILKEEAKNYIVAHSETGHHHVLEAEKAFKIYTWNGETFIDIDHIGKLWHKKSGKDVHKTHEIQPAKYKVVIKKEYDYYAGAIRQVRD